METQFNWSIGLSGKENNPKIYAHGIWNTVKNIWKVKHNFHRSMWQLPSTITFIWIQRRRSNFKRVDGNEVRLRLGRCPCTMLAHLKVRQKNKRRILKESHNRQKLWYRVRIPIIEALIQRLRSVSCSTNYYFVDDIRCYHIKGRDKNNVFTLIKSNALYRNCRKKGFWSSSLMFLHGKNVVYERIWSKRFNAISDKI